MKIYILKVGIILDNFKDKNKGSYTTQLKKKKCPVLILRKNCLKFEKFRCHKEDHLVKYQFVEDDIPKFHDSSPSSVKSYQQRRRRTFMNSPSSSPIGGSAELPDWSTMTRSSGLVYIYRP